jgi:hypothetical protein
MFDYVVGIENIDRFIAKRKWTPEVNPDIRSASEDVGIHVDPTREVVVATRSKVYAGCAFDRRQKAPIEGTIAPHRGCGECVERGLRCSRDHPNADASWLDNSAQHCLCLQS